MKMRVVLFTFVLKKDIKYKKKIYIYYVAAPLLIVFTLSCRAHYRLSIKGKILLKYCNTTKTQGLRVHPSAKHSSVAGVEQLSLTLAEVVRMPLQSLVFFFLSSVSCWLLQSVASDAATSF